VPAVGHGADPQICGQVAGALPNRAEAGDGGAGRGRGACLVRCAERSALREPQVPVGAADQGRWHR